MGWMGWSGDRMDGIEHRWDGWDGDGDGDGMGWGQDGDRIDGA